MRVAFYLPGVTEEAWDAMPGWDRMMLKRALDDLIDEVNAGTAPPQEE